MQMLAWLAHSGRGARSAGGHSGESSCRSRLDSTAPVMSPGIIQRGSAASASAALTTACWSLLAICTAAVAIPVQAYPDDQAPVRSGVEEPALAADFDVDAELDALITELDPPPLEEVLSWFEPYPTVEEALGAGRQSAVILDPEGSERLTALNSKTKAAEEQQRYPDALELARTLYQQTVAAYGGDDAQSRMVHAYVLGLEEICALSKSELSRLAKVREIDRKVRQEFEAGRYETALPLLLEAYKMRRDVLGDDHRDTLESLYNLALFSKMSGKLTASVAIYRACVAHHVTGRGRKDISTLHVLAGMSVPLSELDRAGEARDLASYALENIRRQLGPESRQARAALSNLGGALEETGNLRGALLCREEDVRLEREFGDARSLAIALLNLGGLLSDVGRYADAVAYLEEALALDRQRVGNDHPDIAYTLDVLASTLWMQGDLDRAEPLQREAVALACRTLGTAHPDTDTFSCNLAALLYRRGHRSEAEALARQVLANERGRYGSDSWRVIGSLHVLAGVLLESGQLEESEAAAREGVRVASAACAPTHPYQSALRVRLAQVLIRRRSSNHAEIETLLNEAFQLDSQLADPDLVYTAAILGRFLREQNRKCEAVDAYAAGAAALEHQRRAASGNEVDKARFTSFVAQTDPVGGLVLTIAQLADTGNPESACGGISSIGAFRFYEQGRARSLLSLLQRGRRAAGLEEAGGEEPVPQNPLQALANQECLLAYEVTRDGAALFTLDRTGLRDLCTLSGTDTASLAELQVNPAAVSKAQGLSDSLRLFSETAREAITNASRVYIVPDGPLHQFPFEMLVWNEDSGELWIDAGPPIVYGPSATIIMTKRKWAQERKATRKSDTPTTALVAVGDPIFSRATHGLADAADSPPPEQGVLLAAVGPGSNAHVSGLRAGDVLLSYDGVDLERPADLGPAIQKSQAGREEKRRHQAAAQPGNTRTETASDQAATVPRDAAIGSPGSGNRPPTDEDARPERLTRGEAGARPSATAPADRLPVVVWRGGRTLNLEVAPGRMGVQPSQCPMPLALQDWRELQLSTEERLVRYASATTRSGFGQKLQPLPGTRVEVKALADVMKRASVEPDAVKVLTGQEATLTNVFEVADSPRFLHLATHGKVEGGRRVCESALALTVPEEPTPDDFGFLRLQDLLDKWGGKLDGTELVVLSGCATATGRLEAADGFVGLTWGFLYAGADSVIASLWKVDDAATVLLMHRLYENLLGVYDQPRMGFAPGTEMPKAEALHEAKRWLRNQTPEQNRQMLAELGMDVESLTERYRAERGRLPTEDPLALPDPFDYSDPRFWAAFVLIGCPD